MTMKVHSITLTDIGAPSGKPTQQWAKVSVAFSYAEGNNDGHVSFQLHVSRRPDQTLAELQAEAEEQVLAASSAILTALEQAPLKDWDEKDRAELDPT